MRQLKDNNSGLSLIEVLVAMIILSIVVTPFLHSFFTTANANTKAKKIHRATMVAQNVMEGLKAEDVESIAKQFNYPAAGWRIIDSSAINNGINISAHVKELQYDASTGRYNTVTKYENVPVAEPDKKAHVTASAYSEDSGANVEFLPNSTGKYYYVIDSLKQDNGTYDILVKLDTTTAEATHYNTMDMTQLPIMNEDKDAVCIEKMTYLQNAVDACDVTDISGLRRTITVTVEQTALVGLGGDRLKVVVKYQYANATDSSKNYTMERTYYDSTDSDEDLHSIFLYYTPLYPAYSQLDKIEYINNGNVPVNLYILKQKHETSPGYGVNPTSTTLEENYAMELSIKTSAANWADCSTKLYTNLRKDISSSDGSSISGTYLKTFYNGYETTGIDLSGRMTTLSQDTRVFDMSISVYEGNASTYGFPADKLLTTVDGNKLD